MPRGAKKGERRGGRQKGSKNKRNVEREHRMLQEAVRREGGDMPPLAKDIVEEFMQTALRYARYYALEEKDLDLSASPNEQIKRDWKRNQFKGWARLAVTWATDLAPYQSPTFRAISISHQVDENENRGTTVLHSLDQVKQLLLSRGVSPEQFGRALIEPMPPMIEHEDHGEKKR
jgi:hypothetical protein